MSSINKPLVYNPPNDPLNIIHQDNDLLILSKPAGLLSVPGKGEHLADCLINRAKEKFPEVLLVHRLDMDTSGLIIMAMNKEAQANLGQQFEKRKVDKTYIARVFAHPKADEGLIDLPLCLDWPNRPLQMVCYENGRPSQTGWRVLERENNYRDEKAKNQTQIETSLMELKPITGRSHQLRVHLMELGHPILGDMLYAPLSIEDAASRMQLHAQEITLHHPKGGERITFTDAYPF